MPSTISAFATDFPELVWASTTTLNIVSKRNIGMSVTLSDGASKTNASNITGWTLSANLDTGTIANSTWYYLYAVPSNGEFIVKGSITKPTYVSGAGPTGYSSHRYLGSVRTDASGNIVCFFKDRGFYQYSAGAFDSSSSSNPLIVFNWSSGSSWTVQLNGLTKYPLTAQLVKFGTGQNRGNAAIVTQTFEEQISGTYYQRGSSSSTSIPASAPDNTSGNFYECDAVNGVWRVRGYSSDVSSISANVWVDGCREPNAWFKN